MKLMVTILIVMIFLMVMIMMIITTAGGSSLGTGDLSRSIRSAISNHDLGGKKSLLGARNDEFDDMRLLVRHSVNSSANGL